MNGHKPRTPKRIVTARSKRYAADHSQEMQNARNKSLEHRIAQAVEEITATMKPNDRRDVAEALKLLASGWGAMDKLCPGMSAIVGMAIVEAARVGFGFSKLRSHAAGTAGNVAKGNRTKSRVEEALQTAAKAGTEVNVEAIAAELGVSVGTVYRHLRTLK